MRNHLLVLFVVEYSRKICYNLLIKHRGDVHEKNDIVFDDIDYIADVFFCIGGNGKCG